ANDAAMVSVVVECTPPDVSKPICGAGGSCPYCPIVAAAMSTSGADDSSSGRVRVCTPAAYCCAWADAPMFPAPQLGSARNGDGLQLNFSEKAVVVEVPAEGAKGVGWSGQYGAAVETAMGGSESRIACSPLSEQSSL